MNPRAIELNADLLQPQAGGVRATADAQQHAAESPDFLRHVPLEGHFDRFLPIDQRGHLGVKVDRLEHALEPLVKRSDQIAVGAGQQAVGHFDHRHFASQRGIDGAHFQPDVAAADDQQRLGHVGQFQRPGRIHHPLRRQVERRDSDRARTGGDDAMLEHDPIVGQRRAIDGRELERAANPRRPHGRERP